MIFTCFDHGLMRALLRAWRETPVLVAIPRDPEPPPPPAATSLCDALTCDVARFLDAPAPATPPCWYELPRLATLAPRWRVQPHLPRRPFRWLRPPPREPG